LSLVTNTSEGRSRIIEIARSRMTGLPTPQPWFLPCDRKGF